MYIENVYILYTPNIGHIGDEHFVHCSEVVPSSEAEMYGAGGKQCVYCRDVVHFSKCPLSEVPLYKYGHITRLLRLHLTGSSKLNGLCFCLM